MHSKLLERNTKRKHIYGKKNEKDVNKKQSLRVKSYMQKKDNA